MSDEPIPISVPDQAGLPGGDELPFECPECGQGFKSRFLLGGHRYNAHKVKGTGAGKRGPSTRRMRSTVVEIGRDMARDAGAGRPGVPSAEQLTAAFARGLGTITYAGASFAVETDRNLPTDELKEGMINYLSLSPADAREACEPLGRAFAKTGLNRRYGRAVVDNVDVAGSVAVLITMGLHWRRYLNERRRIEQGPAATPMAPVVPPPQPQAATPMEVPEPLVPVAPNGAAGLEPMQGRVWTKDDVDAAVRRAGQR